MAIEKIIGIPIDQVSYDGIVEDVALCLKNESEMTIVSINPQIILEAPNYPEVMSFIHKGTHRIPDGIGVVMVSVLTGGKIRERITGFDLMIKLLEYANQNNRSCFFYGAKKNILDDMIKNIHLQYPNIIIVGEIDGYTTMKDEEIVGKINESNADFLFVALGFPKQERWISKNQDSLQVRVIQDVGGSFDVLSGHVRRAPQFLIKLHLEWLYRSLRTPKRIGRIFQLPIFLVKGLNWKIKNEYNNN